MGSSEELWNSLKEKMLYLEARHDELRRFGLFLISRFAEMVRKLGRVRGSRGLGARYAPLSEE